MVRTDRRAHVNWLLRRLRLVPDSLPPLQHPRFRSNASIRLRKPRATNSSRRIRQEWCDRSLHTRHCVRLALRPLQPDLKLTHDVLVRARRRDPPFLPPRRPAFPQPDSNDLARGHAVLPPRSPERGLKRRVRSSHLHRHHRSLHLLWPTHPNRDGEPTGFHPRALQPAQVLAARGPHRCPVDLFHHHHLLPPGREPR